MTSHPYFKMSEEMAQKATKRPWGTHEEPYVAHHGREWEISNENGLGVWTAKCQNRSDAAYIVMACNSHAALVEMLKTIIAEPTYETGMICGPICYEGNECNNCKLRCDFTARLDKLLERK